MGLLNVLGSLFRRKRAVSGPSDPLGFFSALLGENYSRLAGRSASVKASDSSLDAWEAALSGEARILAVKARSGEIGPAAWLFFGGQAASRLAAAYRDARGDADGEDPIGLAIAAADALVDRLGDAVALARREGSAAPIGPAAAAPLPSSLSCEIVDKESLACIRWALLDSRVFEYRLDAGDFFLALAPDAAARIQSALADSSWAYAATVLDLSPDRDGRPILGAAADEELRIDGPRAFPLARVLAERRLHLPGSEARLTPVDLVFCATPRPIASRASGGYRVSLRLTESSVEESATLRCLASPLGPYECGSQEWRALVGALAARSAAAIGALLGMEARAAAAGPSSAEEALSGGPVIAVSYNVSFGGARGRALIVLDAQFLRTLCARLLGEGPAERLDLASRDLAFAVDALDTFLKRRAFPSFMRSLREVPPRASSFAARVPVGGRPLYGIMEEMGERDAAAVIGKLVQKGFMLMEHRYAFFFHEVLADPSGVPAIATPCEDYESLFARFPRRWDESDNARSRLRAAFGDLDGLMEAHYEAAWTLYRELEADRLPLSARGEAVLRASGEAFSARLADAIATQGDRIADAVASMDADSKRALPWADKARELCGRPDVAASLAPVLGAKAVDALRDAIARVDARLRDGREDAFALWKDRGEFLEHLASGAKGRGARLDGRK